MSIECAFKVKGKASGDVAGSNTIAGREGTTRCLSFKHVVKSPTDEATGRIVGNRRHEEIEVTVEIDKSVPVLYKMMCNGESIEEVYVAFYHITETGDEKEYYRETMKEGKFTRIETACPMTWDPKNEKWAHYAVLSIRAEQLEKKYVDGAIAYNDDFKAER